MSCWDVLERRARADRDKAAEVVSEVRGRLQEQQALCDRTQEIAEQYQRKIRSYSGCLQRISVIFSCIEPR